MNHASFTKAYLHHKAAPIGESEAIDGFGLEHFQAYENSIQSTLSVLLAGGDISKEDSAHPLYLHATSFLKAYKDYLSRPVPVDVGVYTVKVFQDFEASLRDSMTPAAMQGIPKAINEAYEGIPAMLDSDSDLDDSDD